METKKATVKTDKNKYSDFPEHIQKQVGKEVKYNLRGKEVTTGIVDDLRWSHSTIMEMKGGKRGPEFRGFELRIKPNDGSRAIWTRAFTSGIPAK